MGMRLCRAPCAQATPCEGVRLLIDVHNLQDVLIDIEEEGEEDASASLPQEGAKSDADREPSGAMYQSGATSATDAQPASDSQRRSDAMSPGASASAELEAGKEAEDIVKSNDDGKSGIPGVCPLFPCVTCLRLCCQLVLTRLTPRGAAHGTLCSSWGDECHCWVVTCMEYALRKEPRFLTLTCAQPEPSAWTAHAISI